MDRAMYSVAEMPAACSRSSSFDGMQFHESVRTDSLREAPAHKDGKAWKIRVADLEAYLSSIPPQNQ